MQNYTFAARTFLAVAGLALAAPAIHAVRPYADGDLLLGFRATGGQGSDKNIVVNLGTAGSFTNLAPSATYVLDTEIGNLKADLDFYFGANWQTRADLLWSISGVKKSTGLGFAGNTSFATNPQVGALTLGVQQSSAWDRPATNFHTANPLANRIDSFGDQFALGDGDASPIPGSIESSNGPGILIQNNTGQNSYASFMPNGVTRTASTRYFNGGIEGNFGGGTAGTVLDLYEVGTATGSNGSTGAFEGTFSIDNNANVTFTAAVPEPSSMTALLLGATILGGLRRRNSNN